MKQFKLSDQRIELNNDDHDLDSCYKEEDVRKAVELLKQELRDYLDTDDEIIMNRRIMELDKIFNEVFGDLGEDKK